MDDAVVPIDEVDVCSCLVKDGSLTFLRNGMVNPMCKAVRHRWVILNQGGRIHKNSSAVQNGEVIIFTPVFPELSEADHVNHESALVKDGSLKFKSDGSIKQGCKAVARGWVLVTDDGRIDRRSSAVRSGDVRFLSEGTMLRKLAAFQRY